MIMILCGACLPVGLDCLQAVRVWVGACVPRVGGLQALCTLPPHEYAHSGNPANPNVAEERRVCDDCFKVYRDLQMQRLELVTSHVDGEVPEPTLVPRTSWRRPQRALQHGWEVCGCVRRRSIVKASFALGGI